MAMGADTRAELYRVTVNVGEQSEPRSGAEVFSL